MAVADTIQSIKDNLSDAYDKLEEKGATLPTNKNIENLTTTINSVPSGGGVYAPRYISFYECRLNSLDAELENLSFENMTSLKGVFQNCYNVQSLNLKGKISTNITNMQSMFEYTSRLSSIDFSNCDFSNVTEMGSCFKYLDNYGNGSHSFDFSGMNLTKIQYMSSCFYQSGAGSLNLSTWNTSRVGDMSSMFFNCQYLREVNLKDWSTANVTSFASMFYGNQSLTTITIDYLDASKCTNTSSMFQNCTNLTEIPVLHDLGKAYSTSQPAHNIYYTIKISQCQKISEQNIIDLLNGLYDIATKGCNIQDFEIGSVNKAKMTSAEGIQAIADAEAKGWAVIT